MGEKDNKKYRQAVLRRETGETDITVCLNLDGTGQAEVQTGIGFFDHMLHLLAKHALCDLSVQVERGDLEVDGHHMVEDTGIVLGQLIDRLLSDKSGLCRYGHFYLPMDETLARAVVDLSGRPYLSFNAEFSGAGCGRFDSELVEEFFRALAFNARLTLHLDLLRGGNTHHEIEALFKAFARAFRQAISRDEREPGIPSSKGVLV